MMILSHRCGLLHRPFLVHSVVVLIALAALASTGFAKALAAPKANDPANGLFARDNLIAWCIVPFDSKKRGPEERAAMLERLGFKHFAYDWRAEHIPTFDAEFEALKRHHVALDAFWAARGAQSRHAHHPQRAQATSGEGRALGASRFRGRSRVGRRARASHRGRHGQAPPTGPGGREDRLLAGPVQPRGMVRRAGEPDRDHRATEKQGVTNVGMVYNLHHGHDHLDRFAELLTKMKPYLKAVNLNGMDRGGDRVGRKILPLGQGALDLDLLRIIRDSGYRGPIGILGHTMDDAEQRLQDNLDGLDWLLPQLEGRPPALGPSRGRPCRRLRRRPARLAPSDANLVASLIRDARQGGRCPARGGRLRLAEVRLPLVPPSRRSGGLGRPRPDDRGVLHQARGARRIRPLARADRSRMVTRRSRWPRSTARSVKAIRRRTRRPNWCCATRRRGIGSGSPGPISKPSAPRARSCPTGWPPR